MLDALGMLDQSFGEFEFFLGAFVGQAWRGDRRRRKRRGWVGHSKKWTRDSGVFSTGCVTPFEAEICERNSRAKPEVRGKRATRCSLKAVYRRLTTWGSMLFLGNVIINTGYASVLGSSTIVSRAGRHLSGYVFCACATAYV